MENDKIENYLKKMRINMSNCQHLFLKIEEGNYSGGFHSSDYDDEPCTVICLKCGLTNQFIKMDSKEKEF